MTSVSATQIDVVLSNTPESISQNGVVHDGLSDHSLIFAIRKFILPKSKIKSKEAHNLTYFNENDFALNLSLLPWELVYKYDNLNICWQVWKSLYLEVLNRHTPFKEKN